MSTATIIENGDFILSSEGSDIRTTGSTTVLIMSNSASATLEFGYGDADNIFVPFPDGVIPDSALIKHGRGCKLMVRITGISSGNVVINFYGLE